MVIRPTPGQKGSISTIVEAHPFNTSYPYDLVTQAFLQERQGTDHFVQFYETDSFLLDSLGDYISTGFQLGEVCIVVATQAHRQDFETRLLARGYDPAVLQSQGRYIAKDAAETLALFMKDGLPDERLFTAAIGGLIKEAHRERYPVRIFGEMVALLWNEGNQRAAIQLEAYWNNIRTCVPDFLLFCAYPTHSFVGEGYSAQLSEICHLHSHTIPDESYTTLADPQERLRAITILQQKALSLGAEITERQLERYQAQVQEQQREAFTNLITHELNTPLTALHLNLQLIHYYITQLMQKTELLTAEQQRTLTDVLSMLERGQHQIQMQNRLINDLMDISRVQEDKLTLQRKHFDLVKLVSETIQDYQRSYPSRILQKNLVTSPIEVFADPDRIQQVINNYLNNAFKFSPESEPIEVGMSLDTGEVRVWIRDRGPGLTPEQQVQVWNRFHQSGHTPVQDGWKSGLGLGLYISRQLIHHQGGQVGVESHPGQGATFWFALPLSEQ